jgi:hypothetical protein
VVVKNGLYRFGREMKMGWRITPGDPGAIMQAAARI